MSSTAAPATLSPIQPTQLPPPASTQSATRPRILYVASTRHSGGLEVASVRLADQLMQTQMHRQEIIFACRLGQYIDSECKRLGIPTVPLTIRNSGDFSGVRRLVEIAQSERIDIIHVHSRRDYVTAALAVSRMRRDATISNAPRLLLHLHLVRPLGSPVFLSGYIFAPLVDKVLAVSESVRCYLLRCHPQLAPEQVVVVPNAVDAAKYRRDEPSRARVRIQYGIPPSALVIGMVGRLDAKGQEQIIRALPDLGESRPYLLLVGDEGKPGTSKRLTRLVDRLRVADRVIFCGGQSTVAPFLSAMDIFAHLPLDEAFGLAPAEAMASGLPVLASNISGCAELIEEDRTGLLAGPLKRRDIAAKLARLVNEPALRRRLGAAGAIHVEATYNAGVQQSALTGIYEEMMRLPR